MTCWSNLAPEVLECITSFLPLTDYHRFSAVCKNWRLVTKQKRYSPTPQLPWLVLGDEPSTGKRIFYNLSEDKHYAIDIPELYGHYICGSSHGWLVAIDINITGILINPFTREFYELPRFPQYDIGIFGTTIVPMDYRNGYRGLSLDRLQISVVHKAILSHDPKKRPDFTVMILTGLKGLPAFWKPGNSSWNATEEGHYRTNYFQVLTPDFNGKGNTDWLDSIGNDAIFLGRNYSISIDLSEIPGCNGKTNSIYFTDAARRLFNEKFDWDDMSIFHMRKETLERFYSHELHHTRIGAPIWLTPNPW